MAEQDELAIRSIEGSYFQLPKRLVPTIDLALSGAQPEQVADELGRITQHSCLTSDDTLLLLKRIFNPCDFDVVVVGEGPSARFQFVRRRSATAIDSIKLKFTVLPGSIANYLASVLTFMHQPAFMIAFGVSALVSVTTYVVVFGWHGLSLTLAITNQDLLSTGQVVVQIAIMIFSYLFHEMGHCSATARYGRTVKRVGFGLYWIFPTFFSDVTTSWELTRKQRMVVDVGGIYFQFVISAFLGAACVVFAKSDIVYTLQICLVMNLFSMLISLNPMLKFDGYWLYADWFNISNLRRKSIDFLRRCVGRLLLTENAEIRGCGWALPAYSVASVAYGVLFACYIAFAVISATHSAVRTPQFASHQIIGRIVEGDYLGALVASGSLLISLIPLIFCPVLLLSAFSGIATFARQIARKESGV